MIAEGYTARRTAADRAPARPVIRPNDGPGDWSVRARLAAEAMARAERKRFKVDKPMTAAERSRALREETKLSVLRFIAASDFGVDQRNMAERLGIVFSYVRVLVNELESAGLVEITTTSRGRGQEVTVTATDAGVEMAEGAA